MIDLVPSRIKSTPLHAVRSWSRCSARVPMRRISERSSPSVESPNRCRVPAMGLVRSAVAANRSIVLKSITSTAETGICDQLTLGVVPRDTGVST